VPPSRTRQTRTTPEQPALFSEQRRKFLLLLWED
jgi:hypothetical protein